jgi:HTH-type transcriptional regulator / antitoxin HipB
VRDITIADWSKLGSTIKAQRERLGLTQAAVAERADVSRSWLAKVEAGHRGAELEQIMRLLQALGLTIVLRSSVATEERHQQVAREIRDHHRERSANRRRAWAGDSDSESTHG